MDILKKLTEEFNLKSFQVENTVTLIDDGNTIPFIARYRKEQTGSLDDTVLRNLFDRLTYLRRLDERRAEVAKLIDEVGAYNEDIAEQLKKCDTLTEIEDIYRPYKPKRKTRASVAKEKGLLPLAETIMEQKENEGSTLEIAAGFIDSEKGVETAEAVLDGAADIIAEMISDNAAFRKAAREITYSTGILKVKASKEEDSVYSMYYDYAEAVSKMPSHRILAVNRGEKEKFLSAAIECDSERIIDTILSKTITNKDSIFVDLIINAVQDAYKRLIAPSVEREIRNDMTDRASEQAIKLFSVNLKSYLMQPPVKGNVVLGLDPAYRTGCKLAVVDETGKVLWTGVIYPTPPQSKTEESKKIVKELIDKYNISVIAIGNGTASKESEIFVAEIIKEIDKKVSYMVVNEAGASVYSASELAAKEFPQFDVSLRSAVSIGRRLIDPLAELVKIEPRAIGVGQYQHDMNQKRLTESLGGVVESSVNLVGVDLNTASFSLLSYVSGINMGVAKNIVKYREENGLFKDRKSLLKVPKLGQKAFLQCAGFLRVPDGDNILDHTSVHPESYEAAKELLAICGFTLNDIGTENISKLSERVKELGEEKTAQALNIGVPTLHDIIDELLKPGRDIRDELPKPILRSDLLDIKDLREDMIIEGTVRNVTDFGAFVDIGVHRDGLVHISEISERFVKHPTDVLNVGDNVKVKVISVDTGKGRISLSMKDIKN